MLTPESHHDRRALFQLVRDEMQQEVVGHEAVIRRLAVAGVRHISGGGRVRALLIGPTGSGKSTILRALARALRLPWIEMSAALMSEEGWKGTDLSGHLDVLLRKAFDETENPNAARRLAQRGVVLLDELDKMRVHPTEPGAPRAQHRGKQQSILGLWDGTTISVDAVGPTLEWNTSKTMVVGCGVFEGLDARIPSSGDFAEWGLMPELAERISMGSVFRLRRLTHENLQLVLLMALEEMESAFASFGFRLVVSDTALSMVAATLRKPEFEAGVRAGIGWLKSPCEEALAKMLDDDAPPGSTFTLSPDAVTIPDPPSPKWHDS